ncbi:MAG TPA: hypothetical protein VE422_04495 [Terriglobia bacterium]|nr:hypothetical protein [Terriglobia bacterium]
MRELAEFLTMLAPLHILAGGLALVSGAVALFAVKGARLHRKSGMLFVCAMLTMSCSAVVLAAVRGGAWSSVNIPAALLTAYLVITALTTVRPPSAGSRWLEVGLMLAALVLGLTTLTFGFEALAAGGNRNGVPAFPFLMFGVVGLLGSAGDLRVIRSGALRGAPRLARHLWRMCWALWIATSSFFLGPRARVAKIIPEPLLIPAVLALPVLAVLVAMVYWLWRVRVRRSYREIVGVGAQETT